MSRTIGGYDRKTTGSDLRSRYQNGGGNGQVQRGTGASGQPVRGVPSGHPDNPVPADQQEAGGSYWEDTHVMQGTTVTGQNTNKYVRDVSHVKGRPVSDREADRHARQSGMKTKGMTHAPNPMTGKPAIQPAQVASRAKAKQQLSGEGMKGTVKNIGYGTQTDVAYDPTGNPTPETQSNLKKLGRQTSEMAAQEKQEAERLRNPAGAPAPSMAPQKRKQKP